MKYISEEDCCFEQDGFWFRYRSAAIIIEEGCVLMAYDNAENYYYSVGGGVHLGETSLEAVTREVKEETGITYETDRLAFINESLFYGGSSLPGKQCHVIEFYYLMKPKGKKPFQNTEELQWIPLEKFSDYKAFPEFFCDQLNKIPEVTRHFISDER